MDFSTILAVFSGTFLLAALAVWIARTFLDRGSQEVQPEQPVTRGSSPGFLEDEGALVREEAELSTIGLLNILLERFDFVDRVQTTLSQADLNWSVGRVTAAMLLSGALGMALFSYVVWLPIWGLIGISILVGMTPYFIILRRRDRRLLKIEEQFPEAMESIARAMRAGYAFAGAFENVANQTPDPIGKELRHVFTENALGLPWDQALSNLAVRLPIPEVHLFVAAIQVQSRAGGDLSEVLEKFADNMREAAALRGEVRSMSAQGRFAGYILTAMPIAIVFAMTLVNPTFMEPLFQEEIGRTLLTFAVGGLIAAHFIIGKLVDIRL